MRTQKYKLALLTALLLAQTATAQVELVEDRFDYRKSVFEITLRNNGDSVVRLVQLENDVLRYEERLPDSSPPSHYQTLKPAARYLFPNQFTRDLAADPALELKPRQLYKIIVGVSVRHSHYFELVTRIGMVFDNGAALRTLPAETNSKNEQAAIRCRDIAKDSLAGFIRAGKTDYIPLMKFYEWSENEAMQLLAPWSSAGPEKRASVIQLAGILRLSSFRDLVQTALLTDSELYDAAALALFQRSPGEAVDFAVAQIDAQLADNKKGKRNQELLSDEPYDFIEYLLTYDRAAARPLLEGLLKKYLDRRDFGHPVMADVTIGLLKSCSEVIVPLAEATLARGTPEQRLMLLREITPSYQFRWDTCPGTQAYLVRHFRDDITALLRHEMPALRRVCLEWLADIDPGHPNLALFMKNALQDADEMVRKVAADRAGTLKLTALAPDLLRNMQQCDSEEEFWAYFSALEGLGRPGDPAIVGYLFDRFENWPDNGPHYRLAFSYAPKNSIQKPLRDLINNNETWSLSDASETQAYHLATIVSMLFDLHDPEDTHFINDLMLQAKNPRFLSKLLDYLLYSAEYVNRDTLWFPSLQILAPTFHHYLDHFDDAVHGPALALSCQVNTDRTERINLLRSALQGNSSYMRSIAARQVGRYKIFELKDELMKLYEMDKNEASQRPLYKEMIKHSAVYKALIELGVKPD